MKKLDPTGDLRLTVDQTGCVWYAQRDRKPECAREAWSTFSGSSIVRKAKQIAVPGSRRNFAIILKLHDLCLRGALDRYWICNPSLTEGADGSAFDPFGILLQMLRVDLPASTGGWHTPGPVEIATWQLIAEFVLNGFLDSDKIRLHPLFRHAAFIRTLNVPMFGRFLVENVDPRFCRKTDCPDIWTVPLLGDRKNNAPSLLRSVWDNGQRPLQLFEVPLVVLSELGNPVDADRIDLLVLSYLMSGWVNLLPSTHRGRLFVPDFWCRDRTLTESWRDYMRAGALKRNAD